MHQIEQAAAALRRDEQLASPIAPSSLQTPQKEERTSS